jgi:hypothetical protein
MGSEMEYQIIFRTMKKLILTLAIAMLAMRSPAPIPSPVISFISYSQTNSVTIYVTGEYTRFPLAIQMTTSLTNPDWIWVQTNNQPAGVVTFTGLPATNAIEYFRAATLVPVF